MYRRIIINDTRKNKLITITTMAFVAAAAMLVSLAAILLINLLGAMDTLIEQGTLIGEPDIIFGDEPTGSLNSKSAQEIMDIIGRINQDGTTVLLVTHDAKVAAQVQRVLFMQDGNIVDELKLPKYDGGNLDSRMQLVLEKMRQIEI